MASRPNWLFWTMSAVISWGVWGLLSKYISGELTPEQTQAASVLGMIPVLVWLLMQRPGRRDVDQGYKNGCRTGVLVALASGVVSAVGNLPFFRLLSMGEKAATVVPLTALAPLVTILLAVPFLGERLSKTQIIGAVLSLAAIYFLNIPSEQGFFSSQLRLAIWPIVLWGTTGFLQKLSGRWLSGEATAVWFLAGFMPFSLLLLVPHPLPASISVGLWIAVVALGFLLAFGNIAVIQAFSSGGQASVVMPVANLYPLVTIALSIMLLGERIGLRETIGTILAVLAIAALAKEPIAKPPNDSSNVPFHEKDGQTTDLFSPHFMSGESLAG
jgi:transporter family protein